MTKQFNKLRIEKAPYVQYNCSARSSPPLPFQTVISGDSPKDSALVTEHKQPQCFCSRR